MLKVGAQLNNSGIKLMNQFYGHIKTSIYLFVNLKYISGKPTGTWTILLVIATLLISPLFFIGLWLLRAIKFLIGLKIAFSEGTNFVKLLDGTESIFIMQESKESRVIITTFFLVDYTNKDQSFVEFCTKEVSQIFSHEKFDKLKSIVRLAHGFYYFIKSPYRISEQFQDLLYTNNITDNNNNNNKMSETMTMEEFREIISDLANAPMPCNNEALWEMRICNKQVLTNRHGLVYPLVLRFHHVLGDAMSLFNLFSTDFQHRVSSQSQTINEKKTLLRPLNERFTNEPFIMMSGLVAEGEDNFMCRTNGNKHVLWDTEEQSTLLADMKSIKQKFNNVTVVDIILTCFLESWDQLMQKNVSANYPENILITSTMMPQKTNFSSYGGCNDYTWDNKFTLGFLKLPLKLNASSENSSRNDDVNEKRLLQRLAIVHEKYDMFKNKSLDAMCNRWLGKVLLSAMPRVLLKTLVDKYQISMMASNIPGCKTLKFFGALSVKEFVVVDPNTATSGVTIMVTTYENRLSFAYTIDKAVLTDIEDVRQLAKNVQQNIHFLKSYSLIV